MVTLPRAVMVCVDYGDLLEITLPYNRHHFNEILVVTSPCDTRTKEIAAQCDCLVHETSTFWANGAVFNKWASLEEALDKTGRHGGDGGWLCIMDADVLWPKVVPWERGNFTLTPGNLYTPLRRMMVDLSRPLPREEQWKDFSIHPNVVEWAGYSQLFHESDSALGKPPWHEVEWIHAGGADSFFQMKWPAAKKIRPPFEVLHLGPAGVNWCGRASAYYDGTYHPEAEARKEQVRRFVRGRKSGSPITRYAHEKLSGDQRSVQEGPSTSPV